MNIVLSKLARVVFSAALVLASISCAFGQELSWLNVAHGGVAKCAAIPNSNSFFSLDAGRGNLKKWDIATGQYQGTINLPFETGELDVSRDGSLVVVSNPDGSTNYVLLFSTINGQGRGYFITTVLPAAIKFSSDGASLFIAGSNQLARISTTDGSTLIHRYLPQNTGAPRWLQVSPDGLTIYLGCDYQTLVLDANTLTFRMSIPAVSSCGALSPDGLTLATAGNRPSEIELWDSGSGLSTGRLVTPVILSADSLAFDKWGDLVAAFSGNEIAPQAIASWQVNSGHLNFFTRTNETRLTDAAPLPNGDILVSGGTLGATSVRGSNGSYLRSYAPSRDWGPIAMAPDGQSLLAGGGFHSTVFRTSDGSELWSPSLTSRNPTRLGAFSPDGRFVVGWDSESIRIFDASTGQFIRSIPYLYSIVGIAFSADGTQFAYTAAGNNYLTRRMVLFSTADWHWRGTINLPDWPNGPPQFTPDGRHLLVAGDRSLASYDTQTLHLSATTRLIGSDNPIRFSISPDGQTVAASEEIYPSHFIRFLHANGLKQFDSWNQWPEDVRYSPDGRYLWMLLGGRISAYDADSFTFVYSAINPEIQAASFAISRDNSAIAFCRADGTVGLFANPLR